MEIKDAKLSNRGHTKADELFGSVHANDQTWPDYDVAPRNTQIPLLSPLSRSQSIRIFSNLPPIHIMDPKKAHFKSYIVVYRGGQKSGP